MDIPGAEERNRDSRMEAALCWCCCLEDRDGDLEAWDPEPRVKRVFCGKEKRSLQHMVSQPGARRA